MFLFGFRTSPPRLVLTPPVGNTRRRSVGLLSSSALLRSGGLWVSNLSKCIFYDPGTGEGSTRATAVVRLRADRDHAPVQLTAQAERETESTTTDII